MLDHAYPLRACSSAPPWSAIPRQSLSVALLAATTAILLWSGRRFYAKAWSAARHATADMNTLIALGTGAAFLYSAAQ